MPEHLFELLFLILLKGETALFEFWVDEGNPIRKNWVLRRRKVTGKCRWTEESHQAVNHTKLLWSKNKYIELEETKIGLL